MLSHQIFIILHLIVNLLLLRRLKWQWRAL
jgi:hypothetical protein